MSRLWRAIVTTAQTWLMRSKTLRRLSELDARQLVDIGLTKPQRRRECAKRFWQA
jgi:uncharacterized protein YjiS (DUF1127 family)